MSGRREVETLTEPCPKCGGEVIVVDERAWCISNYADGGCGSFWAVDSFPWAVDADQEARAVERQ